MKHSAITERPWGKFEQFTHNELSTVKIIEVLAGIGLLVEAIKMMVQQGF